MKIELGWKEYKVKWGDGTITCELKPLSVGAMLSISPWFSQEDGEVVLTRLFEIQKAAREILPDHCKELKGLEDEEGQVSVERFGEESALMHLAVELAGELLSRSRLAREDEGN